MPHGSHYSRVLQLVTKTTDAFRADDWTPKQIDPDGLKYVATISVRAHWFIIAVLLFELVYRPYLYFGVARYALFPLLLLVLIGFNGYIHFRILSNKRITWRWVFALYALDVVSLAEPIEVTGLVAHYIFGRCLLRPATVVCEDIWQDLPSGTSRPTDHSRDASIAGLPRAVITKDHAYACRVERNPLTRH